MSDQVQGRSRGSGCLALIAVLLLIGMCQSVSTSDTTTSGTTSEQVNSSASASTTSLSTSTPNPTTEVVQGSLKVNANLRSGPSTKHEVYRQLVAGTQVKLIAVSGEGDTKWYKAVVDEQEGWLSVVVLEIDQNAVAQLPQATNNEIATSSPAGLGITRSAVQSVYERPSIGFTFETSSPVRGQPRVMGQAPNEAAMLELIGPADNLSKATIIVGVPNDNEQVVAQNTIFLLGLPKTVLPNWDESTTWVTNALEEAVQTGNEITTLHGSGLVKLTFSPELGMVTLSITSQE